MSLLLLFALSQPARAATTYVWFQPWKDVPQLVEVLGTIPEGRAVLAKAHAFDPAFATHVEAGQVSFTERDLVEAPGETIGSVKLEQHQTVKLKRDLPLSDAVVDLAHELTHFTERHALDPFADSFTEARFVKEGIEGEGSELKAFTVECKVAWALEKEFPAFPSHPLCAKFKAAGDIFLTESARKGYYALGKWRGQVSPALAAALPDLSDQPVAFPSGYDGKPYPISLSEEFARTLRNACGFSRWKRSELAARAKAMKLSGTEIFSSQLDTLLAFEKKRCPSAATK